MKLKLPQIYPITDTRISGLSHLEQVKRLVEGGATFVQLREKHATPRDFYEAAKAVIAFARAHDVAIVINDRVDIAIAVNAHGVHLGQDDLSPAHARRLLGSDAIIGYSTHSLGQAHLAAGLPIDYVAFGPIFETSTKKDPDPTVGIQALSEIRNSISDLPLVAIGGIDGVSLRSVLKAGADSAAMIGSILSSPDDIARNYLHLSDVAARTT